MHSAEAGKVTYARLKVSADEFLATYDSNPTQGCYANWVDERVEISRILGIDHHVDA